MVIGEQIISCPRCGKNLFKIVTADKTCLCPNCNTGFYVYRDGNGYTLIVDSYKMNETRFRERMQAFVLEIEREDEGYFDIIGEENHVKAFGSILDITEKGYTAEVKRTGDGSLKVYEVSKKITYCNR